MKDLGTKERFIELRAKGYSFERISGEIDVSKPTLIKWKQEFEREIANVRFLHFEQLIEQYGLMKQSKIEAFGELLQKTIAELKNRDLTTASVKDLIALVRLLETRLDEELHQVEYRTGDKINVLELTMLDAFREVTVELET